MDERKETRQVAQIASEMVIVLNHLSHLHANVAFGFDYLNVQSDFAVDHPNADQLNRRPSLALRALVCAGSLEQHNRWVKRVVVSSFIGALKYFEVFNAA